MNWTGERRLLSLRTPHHSPRTISRLNSLVSVRVSDSLSRIFFYVPRMMFFGNGSRLDYVASRVRWFLFNGILCTFGVCRTLDSPVVTDKKDRPHYSSQPSPATTEPLPFSRSRPLRQSKPRSRASTPSRLSPTGRLGCRSLFLDKSCSTTCSRPHRRTTRSTSISLRARRLTRDDLRARVKSTSRLLSSPRRLAKGGLDHRIFRL